MKRRKPYVLLAVIATAAMLTAMLGQAASAAPSSGEIDMDSLFPVTKNETVYVKTNQSGKPKSIIVSDELTGTGEAGSVYDASSLTDIENVKGEEAFKQSGEQLTWDNKGEDIVYQGKTEQALPVSYTVKYQLDGKDISPKDLKGKSGHLKVRYDYHNDTDLAGGRYTPFLTVTGIILDQEHFKHVQFSANGHFESDGQRKVVLGYSVPGLLEFLGIEEDSADLGSNISLSDSFEYEADVTDYEAPTNSTIVTNEVFTELNGGALDSADDLEASLGRLADASSQLVSGSSVLSSGVKQLQNGSTTLSDGVKQLAGGGKNLADGTKQVADGASSLSDGISQAASGAQSLSGGIAKINSQVSAMASDSGELSQGLQGLVDGAQGLVNGLGSVNQTALSLSATASEILNSPSEGTTLSAADKAKLQGIIAGLDGIAAATGTGEDSLGAGALALKKGAAAIKTKVIGGLQQLAGATAADSQLAQGATGLAQVLSSSGGIGAGAAKLASGSASLNSGADTLANGLNALNGKIPALTSGVNKLADGADELAQGMKQFDSEGIQKLVDYMDGDIGSLLKKVKEMTANAKQYNNYSGIADGMNGSVKFIFIQD